MIRPMAAKMRTTEEATTVLVEGMAAMEEAERTEETTGLQVAARCQLKGAMPLLPTCWNPMKGLTRHRPL
eukprot:4385698-Pyramimonas_sp.AAC.1